MTAAQSTSKMKSALDPSTWRTSLMGSDLQALQDLSRSTSWREIKTIIVEDDSEKKNPEPMVAGPHALPPTSATHVWPRDEKRNVRGIGTAELREMLKARVVQPELIIVRDFRGGNDTPSPEPPAQLAREVLDDSDVAIISICFRRNPDCYGAFEVVVQLSTEHHAIGTAMLQKAEIIVTEDLGAYWPNFIFHAPNLSKLELKQGEHNSLFLSIPDTAFLNLTSLEVTGNVLQEDQLLSLLQRARATLTNLSLVMVSSSNASSWRSLFNNIANQCTGLTSFNFRRLKVDARPTTNVKFDISESDIPESDRDNLDLMVRGTAIQPVPVPRTISVRYSGANTAIVLRVVAKSVVSWGYVAGSHEVIIAKD